MKRAGDRFLSFSAGKRRFILQYYADSLECLLNRNGKRSWGNGKSQWYIGTPNEVVLCIDQVEEYRFTGRLYHAYSAAATVFLSMDEAVFQMEQLYDSLNYPYPGTIIRSFGKNSSGNRR